MPAKGKISATSVLERMQFLLRDANPNKPVIVFGPIPGMVTEVTLSAGGNITLVYRPLTPLEMGAEKARTEGKPFLLDRSGKKRPIPMPKTRSSLVHDLEKAMHEAIDAMHADCRDGNLDPENVKNRMRGVIRTTLGDPGYGPPKGA